MRIPWPDVRSSKSCLQPGLALIVRSAGVGVGANRPMPGSLSTVTCESPIPNYSLTDCTVDIWTSPHLPLPDPSSPRAVSVLPSD